MIYIGIDPGKKGGFAAIETKPDGWINVKTWTWDNESYADVMRSFSANSREYGTGMIAAVEKVGAMPGQGVTSMFTFGQSYGYILGVLTAFGIPYQLVPPRTWKAEFGLNSDKAKSVEVCKSLFPELNLLPTPRSRVDSDGMAEAALLAMYAKRKL